MPCLRKVTSCLMLLTPWMANPTLAADRSSELESIVGDTVLIRPSSPYYSTTVADTGAQGTVTLLLDLSKDGQVTSARVHTSSHSEELDASAIRKALTMSYQGRGAPPSMVSLNVGFRRDDPYTVSTKSCREFNVDVAWFRNAFPGRPETDMPTVMALANLVRLNFDMAHREQREPLFHAVPFAQCALISGCAASPDATVGKIFNHALHERVTNPNNDEKLCAFTQPTAGNDEELPRSLLSVDLDKPLWVDTQHITPDMPAYPPPLVRSGIQGQVMLEVTVTNQGKAIDIKVTHNQSGIAALADAAVTHARRLLWSHAARAQAPETIVIVPVEFEKDTTATIGNKTCSDFNIDAATYKAAHPQAELRRMNAVAVARDALRLPRSVTEEDMRLTAGRCTEQRQAKFIDIFAQQMRSTSR